MNHTKCDRSRYMTEISDKIERKNNKRQRKEKDDRDWGEK